MLYFSSIKEEQNIDRQQREVTRHDATQHDMSRYTLTIKEASDLFTDYGVPRSPRSIQRFCELENLNCIRVKGEKTERYFVDPLSVERYAQELKQLENISQLGGEVLRHDASQRDTSRQTMPQEMPLSRVVVAPPEPRADEEIVTLKTRVTALQKENRTLKIDRAVKEQIMGQMADERSAWHEQLIAQSREMGGLEMQLQQLSAPRRDMSRHDATELVVDATPLEADTAAIDLETPTTPAITAEPVKRSLWRKIVG